MSDRTVPPAGYLPAEPYLPPEVSLRTVVNQDNSTDDEFFKTNDCADHDPSIPKFKSLLLEAINDISDGLQQPIESLQVDAQDETSEVDSVGSKSPLMDFGPDLVITESALSESKRKLECKSAPSHSRYSSGTSQPPSVRILSARPEQRIFPRPLQRHTTQVQKQPFPAASVSLGVNHAPWLSQVQISPNDLGICARAVRFIRYNPSLDTGFTSELPYPFNEYDTDSYLNTASKEDMSRVLKLAQQQGYFELENHFWSSAQLIGDRFRLPDPNDSSPFACAVRYVRSPFVYGEPWCDIDVHVKKILKEKLSATGHILLRELDPEYIRNAQIRSRVPHDLYQVIEYAKQPSQRGIDWTVESIGRLRERLGLTQVQVQAKIPG